MRSSRGLPAGQAVHVLALIVSATGLLGAMAWQASRRQAELAEALRRSQAREVAQRYAGRIGDELYVGATAVLRPLRLGRFGAGAPDDVATLLRALDAAADSAERCACAPVLRPRWAFRSDLTAEGTAVAGTGDAERERGATRRDWLAAAARDRLTTLHRGWDVAVLPERDPATGHLVFITPEGGSAERGSVVGFGVDPRTLADWVFRPLLAQLNAQDGVPRERRHPPLQARVRERGGRLLFASPFTASARATTELRLGDIWTGLAIEAAFDPGVRSAAVVELPASPLAPLALLLGVAALLVGAALALVWRLAQVARMRADFASSVSHELRTPLTQILLYAETVAMERHESAEAQRAAMAIITREARRLIHLVENVLHFSRAERRLAAVHPRAQPLGPLIAGTVKSFEPIARAAGTVVRVEDAQSPTAPVDADALRQVLLNLLDNAVRHGAPRQTVRVGAERRGAWARVFVEDEGEGIAPADRDRVWEPFVRLDRADGARGTGSGIGLAIVRDLVARHRGRWGVESGAGGGARVFVEIPMT